MEETEISPTRAQARRHAVGAWRRPVAWVSVIALMLVSIPLAMPSKDLTPGLNAPPSEYGSLYGVFGDEGIVDRPMVYLSFLWLAIAIWIVLLAFARDLGLRLVAWTAGILIVLFVVAPPMLSLDIFSYISYARLGAGEGLNPYEFAPSALPVGDDAARRVVDYKDAVSVYGPVFTLLSYPLGLVSVPMALWSLKALAGLAIAAIAAIVARVAPLRGVDPALAVAFVALNPLVLVHLVGGAHNDGLMVAIAMAGVAAVLLARPALGGAALVASAAIKVSGALYAPFALIGARGAGERRRFLTGAAIAVAAVAAGSLLIFGTGVTEALSVASGNQDLISRFSVPAVLSRGTGIDIDLWRAVLGAGAIAALVWLLVAAARGFDWIRAVGWAAFAILVGSAYIVPWYLIWLIPIAAISRDRALIAATIFLMFFQAMNALGVFL